MRKLYHSYLSPYARRALIVLIEKGLEHEKEKHKFACEFVGLGPDARRRCRSKTATPARA
jgi:glutathione S-transferase